MRAYTLMIYDLRISFIYTNTNNIKPQCLVFTTGRSWAPKEPLVKKWEFSNISKRGAFRVSGLRVKSGYAKPALKNPVDKKHGRMFHSDPSLKASRVANWGS